MSSKPHKVSSKAFMSQYKVYFMQHICLFTGAQLHHLAHVGLTGRVGDGRQPGGLNWSPYHEDDNKLANNREPVSPETLSCLD